MLVLEPPLPGGALKTTRNGMGRFVVKALGKAAHTGINPEDGINAVDEIAHQILRIGKFGDIEKKTTVTVAVVEGGTRPNVVPAECFVQVDARTPSLEEAKRVTAAINSLDPVIEGARLEIAGAFRRPPLEPTPANMKLFDCAREIAGELGRETRGRFDRGHLRRQLDVGHGCSDAGWIGGPRPGRTSTRRTSGNIFSALASRNSRRVNRTNRNIAGPLAFRSPPRVPGGRAGRWVDIPSYAALKLWLGWPMGFDIGGKRAPSG